MSSMSTSDPSSLSSVNTQLSVMLPGMSMHPASNLPELSIVRSKMMPTHRCQRCVSHALGSNGHVRLKQHTGTVRLHPCVNCYRLHIFVLAHVHTLVHALVCACTSARGRLFVAPHRSLEHGEP